MHSSGFRDFSELLISPAITPNNKSAITTKKKPKKKEKPRESTE
jgi:hypothetical protein